MSSGKQETPLPPFSLDGAALDHGHEGLCRCCAAGRQLPKGSGYVLGKHISEHFVCLLLHLGLGVDAL